MSKLGAEYNSSFQFSLLHSASFPVPTNSDSHEFQSWGNFHSFFFFFPPNLGFQIYFTQLIKIMQWD